MNFVRLPKLFPMFIQQPLWYAEFSLARSLLALPIGTPGAGAGKGGGGGGSVRESGGGLGKFGAAQEEGYFYGKQKEDLKKIKQKLQEEKDLTTEQKKEDK